MPKLCLDGNWTKKTTFRYAELQEAAAAHTGFTTSKAENDTPAYTLSVKDPDNLKEGRLTRIHMRFNFANAVTLEAVRIYAGAKAGDYESSSQKLYDSTKDYPAGLTDDDEYDIEVDIDFKLLEEGKIYYGVQWSAASGNIQGYLVVEGETIA